MKLTAAQEMAMIYLSLDGNTLVVRAGFGAYYVPPFGDKPLLHSESVKQLAYHGFVKGTTNIEITPSGRAWVEKGGTGS